MAGKRQPTALVEARGKKHMSRAEAESRRDAEVSVPAPDAAEPPTWLLKKHHAEFRTLGQQLIDCGLYADLDKDVLAQYLVARDSWIASQRRAAQAIRAKDRASAKEWTAVQAAYFKQARQAGDAMGLTVTARCRLVLPQGMEQHQDDAPDDFTLRLLERQQRTAEGVS